MEITNDTIEHLASLSNIALSADEAKSLQSDLSNIIKYISTLDELDVNDVEPTFQCFEMQNVFRKDEILPQDADREALLNLAKEVKDNQIKVPKVL